MSVINQMLRDLQDRQGAQNATGAADGLAVAPGPRRLGALPWLLGVVALLLVAGVAAYLFWPLERAPTVLAEGSAAASGRPAAEAPRSEDAQSVDPEPTAAPATQVAAEDPRVPAPAPALAEPPTPRLMGLGLTRGPVRSELTLALSDYAGGAELRDQADAGLLVLPGVRTPSGIRPPADAGPQLLDLALERVGTDTRLRYRVAPGVAVALAEREDGLALVFTAAPTPVARAAATAPPPPAAPSQTPTARAETGIVEAAPPEAAPSDEAGTPVRVVRRASAAEVAEARYREALAALEGNDPYAAERALRAALSTVPNERRAAQTLAGLLLQGGRSREASEIALAALAAHPGDPALSRLAARARLAEGDTAGGIRILEAALPAARGDAPLLALLATLYQREAEHGNAIALYEAALRLRPERGAWWTGLAISLEGAGRGGDAADAYRRALASADLGGALQRYADERLAALTPRAGG